MEQRYSLLRQNNVRNIKEYNEKAETQLPYVVVIVDEYGDLVMTAGREVEKSICRIAQKARAVGIHMIISTQRPSATIVTGNIKANFPVRIAFRTTTGTDSRVIIDRNGAEKLTGRGDMLYCEGADMIRVQGAYVDTDYIYNFRDDVSRLYEDTENPLLLTEEETKPQSSLFAMQQLVKAEHEARERAFWDKKIKEYRAEKERKRYEEEHREEIEARRNRLRQHFYGGINTSYMTLYIPHDSKLKK